MVFIPFGIAAGLALVLVLTLIFAVEVYVSEMYDGPFKEYLLFTPTMLLSIFFPVLTNAYGRASKALTIYENHRTEQGFENAMTQKTFILSFLTGYLSIFLTAYVYVPFGDRIVSSLDYSSLIVGSDSRAFAVDPSRLKQQVIYFGVLGQVLQAVEEYFLPYVTRKFFSEAKRITHTGDDSADDFDVEEQKVFLNKVRREIELPEYDIYEDYDEMVVQFGFISLWSIVWPIIPLACAINNWVEVRSDAAKICTSRRRPIPHRSDSIGPWLDNMVFLAWLGTLTNCTLIYIFGEDDAVFNLDYSSIIFLLVIVLIAEHTYWMVDHAVGKVSGQVKTDGELNVMREDYILRRRQLRQSFGLSNRVPEARDGTMYSYYKASEFWKRKGVEASLRDARDILSHKSGLRSSS